MSDDLPPPDGPAVVEKIEEEKKPESDPKLPTPSQSGDSSSVGSATKKSERSASSTFDLEWPHSLQWVPDNLTWPKLKPTIRSAIAGWISTVLFLVPAVERFLGQASFLILITSFMSPPNDSFMAVLEREFTILFFVTTAWAWSCLGIKLADLARVNRNPNATFLDAVSGQYLEVATGRAIVLPIVFHSAIAILSSIIIFPSSVSAQFTTRLTLVLAPLAKSFELHQVALKKRSLLCRVLFDGCYNNVLGGKIRSRPGSACGFCPSP
ncbi:hypothetical protein MVEN_02032000 [Mycena venus]|uniref:Putative ER transporter 6TM N-terminal domain-containing protein n=1 Tax=Mycena venus TaxID=2733690 RepID=A0A8H6XCQ9_9AGAR|nr:hypothetical protein MVEN_02032000 [Mycena venus]